MAQSSREHVEREAFIARSFPVGLLVSKEISDWLSVVTTTTVTGGFSIRMCRQYTFQRHNSVVKSYRTYEGGESGRTQGELIMFSLD